MYPLYYKGLRLSVTFQVKHLCVGDFASFAKIFAGFYFGKGIDLFDLFDLPYTVLTGSIPAWN